jgi:hypothetical protein
MLTRGWLPSDTAHPVEAKQAEFRAEPEIPIGRLGNGVDVAQGEPVLDGPRSVPILADLQRWIKRQNGRSPEQQAQRADRNECQASFHLKPAPVYAPSCP